jgi:hypothetical protein
MNNRIETFGAQDGHIKGVTDFFSAAKNVGFSGEFSGAEVIRSDANQGSDLLAVEPAEFGQKRYKRGAGAGAYAFGASQDFIFLSQVIVGFDLLFDEFVEFGNLVVEGFYHLSDAFAYPGMADGLAAVQFLCAQVSELSAATHQVGQFVDLRAGRGFWLRLNDLSETGEDACVNGVGLGPFAETSREVTDLARGSDDNLEICLEQFGDDGTFVAAGCFEDDQFYFVRLKDFDELLCARGRVGQRNVDGGGTRGDVKCVFGNVDADEEWFLHGFLPILRIRTRRPRGSAVPAAVRANSTVATRITLCDGLADQNTTDLSSPASCVSARYARLTARRLYYGTFNHDICQHTRTRRTQRKFRH